MSGIGPATERRLKALGIRTLGELARADASALEREFGVLGPRMITRAAGREVNRVCEAAAPEETKSVSNERTFGEDLTDRAEIVSAIKHIASVVGRRLRKKGLRGHTVTLKVKYDASHARTAQRALDSPTNDEHVFGAAAAELLDELWHDGVSVRLLGVGISGFDETKTEQMSPLDMVVFVADRIEPLRPGTPGIEAVRALVGKASLEDLFWKSFTGGIEYVIEGGRYLYPGTIDVYNSIAARRARR